MKTRVLVVDDQPDVVAFCERVIEFCGYETQRASSGEEALALLRETPFDALVTDIMMPGMTGIELLARAHDLYPNIAAVIVTGFADIELAIKALRAGAQDFVTKPFTAAELEEAIEHALSQARMAAEWARYNALWPLFELSRRALSDVDMEAWCAEVVDIGMAETKANGAILLLIDATDGKITYEKTKGALLDPRPDFQALLEIMGNTDQAVVLTPDNGLSPDLAYSMSQAEIGAVLWAPLHAPSRSVGVLLLTKASEQEPFQESDVEIVSILGSQAAAFLDNTYLVERLESWNRKLETRVEERTRELARAQERLLRSQRLATVGQLGASVAHELRNPLGVINNSVYYLNTRLNDADAKMVKHLNIIAREVSAANKIITDLMSFTRVGQLKTSSAQPNSLVRRTLERAIVPDAVHVHVALAPDLPRVRVDAGKMEQVFLNLINNAVQAMPGGGDLHITAGVQHGHVEFAFLDTGTGIPPENIERIFEPLFTTRAKGTGLGLAVVRTLVEAHNGEIAVRSRLGEGSCFTVRLPCEESGLEGTVS